MIKNSLSRPNPGHLQRLGKTLLHFPTREMKKSLEILGILIGVLVLGTGGFGFFLWGAIHYEWKYEVANLPCGSDRRIVVYAPYWSELALPLYYQVYDGGEKQFETPQYLGNVDFDTSGKLRFAILHDKKQSIAALIETTNPQAILALYDFDHGTTWPGKGNAWEKHRQRALAMLTAVQSAHPADHYVLQNERTEPIGAPRSDTKTSPPKAEQAIPHIQN